MGRLKALTVGAVLLLPMVAAAAAAPLLVNGRFTEAVDGIPNGWRPDAWNREYSEYTWEADGSAGGAVRIVNHTANDARLCQTIPVVPGGSYHVSARVKTAGVGMTTAGALIALEPRIADSPDLKGTQDWQTIDVTAESGERDSMDVCLRLGSYSNLNTGTAWFSDVRVEQVGGPAPGSAPGWWSRVSAAPLLAALRRSSWWEVAVPLLGGGLLALGLGVVGRRPD